MRFIFLLFLLFAFANAEFRGDWETITNMNDIRDLKFDDGKLWAATTGGIYSYRISDGSVEKFTNTDGLLSIDVESIELDDHGHILYGGDRGILEVREKSGGGTYQLYNIEGNPINEILFHRDTLWVAAGKGLAVFVYTDLKYKFKDFYKNFDVLPNQVSAVEIFAGRVWLGTDKGVLSAPSAFGKYTINDPALWNVYDQSKGLTHNSILDLEVVDGVLWIGTASGITTINANFIVKKEEPWGATSADAANVILSLPGQVVIANNNLPQRDYRLYGYSADTGQKNQLAWFRNPLNCLQADPENGIWSGVAGEGLFKQGWKKSFMVDGPGQNQIRYVIRDRTDKIWASSGKFKLTPNKGFFVYDGNYWTNIDFLDVGWSDLGNTDIIFEDPAGNVWLGTWGGGLMTYSKDEFIYFHNYETTGRMIISTKDTLIYEDLAPIDPKYSGFFSDVVTFPTYEVIGGINVDTYNRLWVANYYASNDHLIAIIPYTTEGFVSLEKDDWIYLGRKDRLTMQDGAITSIAFDDFNRAWLGTFSDGVFVLEYDQNGNFTFGGTLTTSDNLYGNRVLSIAKDQDGVMWIGTSAGLNSYDGVNVYKHVGDSEGLSGPLENQINQIVVDKYNNKWFATTGGLSILRGGRSPWDATAWIGYTTGNSGLVDNNVNTVFVDPERSEALVGTENGLSVYRGSFAQIQDDYSRVIGGPNPFIPESEPGAFTLTNLEFDSIVNIYNLNGQLVRSLNVGDGNVDGSRAVWDGRDSRGRIVSSGVYFYMAFTEEGSSVTGKFAVVRR